VCRFLCSSFFICFVSLAVRAQLPELVMQNTQTQDEINTVLSMIGNNAEKNEVGFILSLARNYYKLDNYIEAEKYFLKVIDQDICSSLDYKALSICLLNNNKKSLANEFYAMYQSRVSENINFKNLWDQVNQSRTNKIRGIRAPASDYNMVYGNLDEFGKIYLNLDNGSVTANLVCNELNNMEVVMLPVDNLFRVGSFTAGPNEGSYIYSFQESEGYYNLYFVEKQNDKWRKPLRLNLGENMSHYVHPFFVKSQNLLYFSSDKSGGNGGFDLYAASFDNKKELLPLNLGQSINTDKNELLPSMYSSKLAFASNGHPGYGGYDIFFSDKDYGSISHFKKPYNSSLNEFVVFNRGPNDAVIVGGERDETRIIEIRKIVIKTNSLHGRVSNEEGRMVSNARILFKQGQTRNGTFVTSDSLGEFQIFLPDSVRSWNVEVLHKDYTTQSVVAEMSSLRTDPLIVTMEHKEEPEIEQVYIVNSPSRNVIPTTPVKIEGNVNSSTQSSQMPSVIFDEIEDDIGRYYVILGSARSYIGAYNFWQKWQTKFPNAEILEYKEKGIYRVGEYAGTTHAEAMSFYKKAKRVKTDVWILRPDL
jgi:tetratricopeptide (TPR) repeat protein